MTDEEVEEARYEARGRVGVRCDENHVHTASCLEGDKNAVNVCRLVETLLKERAALRALVARLGK